MDSYAAITEARLAKAEDHGNMRVQMAKHIENISEGIVKMLREVRTRTTGNQELMIDEYIQLLHDAAIDIGANHVDRQVSRAAWICGVFSWSKKKRRRVLKATNNAMLAGDDDEDSPANFDIPHDDDDALDDDDEKEEESKEDREDEDGSQEQNLLNANEVGLLKQRMRRVAEQSADNDASFVPTEVPVPTDEHDALINILRSWLSCPWMRRSKCAKAISCYLRTASQIAPAR